jgi:hypothetical protein
VLRPAGFNSTLFDTSLRFGRTCCLSLKRSGISNLTTTTKFPPYRESNTGNPVHNWKLFYYVVAVHIIYMKLGKNRLRNTSQFKISSGFENVPAASILLSLIPSWFKVSLVVKSIIVVVSKYILFN